MNRFQIILNMLKQVYLKKVYARRKNVKFGRGVFFDVDTCEFEGGSQIFYKSTILNSYIGYGNYVQHHSEIVNAKIGRFVSIGPNVKFIVGQHPTSTFVSTHPAFFSRNLASGFTYSKEQKFPDYVDPVADGKYQFLVGSDTWFGDGAMIMSGVTIGDGAVIAAGAVVTKDIPPYAIAGGVPAKVIRYRFDEEDIRFLMDYKWWDRDISWIESHADYFDDIERFKYSSKDGDRI